MDAAVYLRQSVDKYGDELRSVASVRIASSCARNGADAPRIRGQRQVATRGVHLPTNMLDDIRAGHIGAGSGLGPAASQPIELEHFIDLADQKNLALASVGGDADLSTDNGRLFARIKGAVARAEIERKSARQKRAARQRAEAGIWSGPRPFGYTESGGLVAAEAAALREAYSATSPTHRCIRLRLTGTASVSRRPRATDGPADR